MTHVRPIAAASPTRLSGFVVASLCLHLGLLWPWIHASAPALAGARETVLSVSLSVAAPAVAPALPAPKPATHATPLREHREKPSTPATSASAPIAALPPERAPPTDAHADGVAPQPAHAKIQAQLLADLQRHFQYPALARRQGWQGTVWVTFTVEPNGALDRIHVAQSSGYRLLDSSALDAMQRVGRLNEANHWLNGRALEMRLPVVYRLVER